jgi:putative glycosyltransferase
MKRRIKYIDTICTNSMHIVFNASLLSLCRELSSQIIFYGERRNQIEVLNTLKENSFPTDFIETKSIFLLEGNSKYKHILNFFISFVYNTYFVLFSNKNDILLFNYNNLLSIRFINFLNKICHKKIIIFCHGEMELLEKQSSGYGLFNKLLLFLGKKFFLNKNIHIQRDIIFFVLGDSILSNLKKIIPKNIYTSFHSIDHPYFFKREIKEEERESNSIKIGTVGVFSKQKGGDDFYNICKSINNPNIEFSITGRIFYDVKKLTALQIDLPPNKGKSMLSKKELEDRASMLDFILFLYPKDSYRLIASGAILEAISLKKPILALRNDYFNYLFKKFGDFGYLTDSIEELISLINTIQIKNKQFNFDTIQNNLSIENITTNLKNELIKIGFI